MRHINHKYLEEAGLTEYADNTWGSKRTFEDIRREHYFNKIKRQRGVDPRACWALDTSILQFIYEHLCAYIDDASGVVDITYHKFDYEGKEYNQLEMMNILKEYILKYLKIEKWEDDREEEKDNYLKKIFDILYMIFPALWW